MSTKRHPDADELALIALGLLDEEEMAEVTPHLRQCAECRRELARIRGDLAMLALTATVHSPPAAARERLLWQVRREGRPAVAPRSSVTRRAAVLGAAAGLRRVEAEEAGQSAALEVERGMSANAETAGARGLAARLLPWTGWALAAGLAVSSGVLLRERNALRGTTAAQAGEMARLGTEAEAARQILATLTDPAAMKVTLTRPREAVPPVGRVNYLPETGALVFLASNLATAGPYRTYELWLIPADGRDPMPAGTFRPDAAGNASVILPALPQGVAAKAFGITLEDEGGSRTPTMPILLAGR